MDPLLALAGFGVGIVVGLTGMGGGALMTPILVIFFGVPPLAAVSSDLAASAVMKPFGGWVHALRGTVNWRLVGWLCVGSVPSAFTGVLVLRRLGDDESVRATLEIALGIALLLAAGGLVFKLLRGRHTTAEAAPEPIRVRPLPTALLGAGAGLVVGLTSVGSGSLIIVVLLALYPTLRANDVVGTDLVQAVPLVAAAAIGHAFFGDLRLDVAGAVLLGSVPGVLLGARVSSRAPSTLVRGALVVVLLASALKLFNVPAPAIGAVTGAIIVLTLAEAMRRRLNRRGAVRASGTDPAAGPAHPASTTPTPAARDETDRLPARKGVK